MSTTFENCGRTWKTKELSPKTHKLWSLNMTFDKDELLCESDDISEIHRYQAMFQAAPHCMSMSSMQIEFAMENLSKKFKPIAIVRFLNEFDLYIEGCWIRSFKSIQELRNHCRKMRQDRNWNRCDSY